MNFNYCNWIMMQCCVQFEAHEVFSLCPAGCIHDCVFVLSPRGPVRLCCLCRESMFPGGQWRLQLPLPSHTALHEGLPLPVCCHHPLHSRWNNWVILLLSYWCILVTKSKIFSTSALQKSMKNEQNTLLTIVRVCL